MPCSSFCKDDDFVFASAINVCSALSASLAVRSASSSRFSWAYVIPEARTVQTTKWMRIFFIMRTVNPGLLLEVPAQESDHVADDILAVIFVSQLAFYFELVHLLLQDHSKERMMDRIADRRVGG